MGPAPVLIKGPGRRLCALNADLGLSYCCPVSLRKSTSPSLFLSFSLSLSSSLCLTFPLTADGSRGLGDTQAQSPSRAVNMHANAALDILLQHRGTQRQEERERERDREGEKERERDRDWETEM